MTCMTEVCKIEKHQGYNENNDEYTNVYVQHTVYNGHSQPEV